MTIQNHIDTINRFGLLESSAVESESRQAEGWSQNARERQERIENDIAEFERRERSILSASEKKHHADNHEHREIRYSERAQAKAWLRKFDRQMIDGLRRNIKRRVRDYELSINYVQNVTNAHERTIKNWINKSGRGPRVRNGKLYAQDLMLWIDKQYETVRK